METEYGMPESAEQVKRLLIDWSKGDKTALTELTPLVYAELRRLAATYLRQERPDHTLQPTALVHEAYIRLVSQSLPDWKNRSHFFGVAAQLMRQILVDYARQRRAAKRDGGQRVPMSDTVAISQDRTTDLLALDEALIDLAQLDPRKVKIIELRFFAGLSVEETAMTLDVSAPTIHRETKMAETWLYRRLNIQSA
jgi:RNA polymerase sigma factor (TIGR02999 family)